MTLVEVIAALAILGSLLTSLLVLQAQLIRAERDRREVRAAIEHANALLEAHWAQARRLPLGAQGSANPDGSLQYRFIRLDDATTSHGAYVAKSSSHHPPRNQPLTETQNHVFDDPQAWWTATGLQRARLDILNREARVLVSVEVLVQTPEAADDEATGAPADGGTR